MSTDETHVAWIDYVIASDDPTDLTLGREFIARQWAFSQTLQWVMREMKAGTATEEALVKIEEEQKLSDELQARVCHRGKELLASGAKPADAAFAEAWHDRWRNISPTLPVDDLDQHLG